MLYSTPMERVKVSKYLGSWLDGKYTWKNHIENIETKCKKVLNLMRCVVGFQWGTDREASLHIQDSDEIYLDYGCMAYESAAKSHIEKQYREIRLRLGASKTTPINTL